MLTLQKTQVSADTVSSSAEPRGLEPWSLEQHWPALLADLADQITGGVSALQNSIDLLLEKGRISRLEHRALSIPAERVKAAGISAQQIHRFHQGRIRQSHEKVDMAELVESVLQERKQELALLGVELRRKLKPVEVLVDPTVVYAFANAVLDWCLPFGSRIDVRVDLDASPTQCARLALRVSHEGSPPSSQASADGVGWMLVRQIAQSAGGIDLERTVSADGVDISALFARTVQAVDGICAVDLADEQSSMFKSLAGVYALTISPVLQVRAEVRDALEEIGIASDSVVDFDQAREAMRFRMPNLIVLDAALKGGAFDAFRRDLLLEMNEFPFVEISPDGRSFDLPGPEAHAMARVGRGNIRDGLGTAVMFELAKLM